VDVTPETALLCLTVACALFVVVCAVLTFIEDRKTDRIMADTARINGEAARIERLCRLHEVERQAARHAADDEH
jgi:hypothetical protein